MISKRWQTFTMYILSESMLHVWCLNIKYHRNINSLYSEKMLIYRPVKGRRLGSWAQCSKRGSQQLGFSPRAFSFFRRQNDHLGRKMFSLRHKNKENFWGEREKGKIFSGMPAASARGRKKGYLALRDKADPGSRRAQFLNEASRMHCWLRVDLRQKYCQHDYERNIIEYWVAPSHVS